MTKREWKMARYVGRQEEEPELEPWHQLLAAGFPAVVLLGILFAWVAEAL